MVEELKVEKNSLLKSLKDIESFILILFSVVCIVNSHNNKTRGWDLCKVFEDISLDNVEESQLFLLIFCLRFDFRVNVIMSQHVDYFKQSFILLRVDYLETLNNFVFANY